MFKIPSSLQHGVTLCLQHYLTRAQLYFQEIHFPVPFVDYHQRGSIAGKAYLHEWRISLNAILLMENQNAFITTVVPHELAHLLAYRLHGRVAPHGKEWRWFMEILFQLPAERTHCFDIHSVQGKIFEYKCACQTHRLTVRRHNRIIHHQYRYKCRFCGEILKFQHHQGDEA